MSYAFVASLLEDCGVSGRFLRSALCEPLSSWLEEKEPTSLFLIASWSAEGKRLVGQMAQMLQTRRPTLGAIVEQEAELLLQQMRLYGKRTLRFLQGGIVVLRGLEEMSSLDRKELWFLLSRDHCAEIPRIFLGSLPALPSEASEKTEMAAFFPHIYALPPLYQRGPDIDTLLFEQAKATFATHRLSDLRGFSLEAAAHIHRAILQTRRDCSELETFLEAIAHKIAQGRMPLEEGTILAWPTIRLLEEMWGYNVLLAGQRAKESLASIDLQSHLFSASLEQASQKSGFSRDLIEMQLSLLQKVIHELPAHQRNYQGMTASLDHLMWLSMKLLSGARTQSEMRDFFGFRTEGKIPKATAKLKFDQYSLEEIGFRSCDPLPWNDEEDPLERNLSCDSIASEAKVIQLFPSSPADPSPDVSSPPEISQNPGLPDTSPAPASLTTPSSAPAPSVPPRIQLSVQGEVAETLFWRYQDLFAVLAGDPLSALQIAQITKQDLHSIEEEMEALVKQGLLKKEKTLYALPSQDMYFKHTHSRFLEENLLHTLAAAFAEPQIAVLDNSFYRFPTGGLPRIREQILQPFLSQQLMPRSDIPVLLGPEDPYPKKMGAFLLLGTSRVSGSFQTRPDLKDRILHYFREAYLQRASERQKQQAICLQATMMLLPAQMDAAAQDVRWLRSRLRSFLPQGRGMKPNFNLTLCFTEVPLRFSREHGSEVGLLPGLVGVSR